MEEKLRKSRVQESAELIALANNCVQPHILLKLWANGKEAAGITPNPAQQLACSIAAANYFAPKLQAIETKTEVTHKAVISARPVTVEEWSARYSPTQITDNRTYQQLPATVDAEAVEVSGTGHHPLTPLASDPGNEG